MRELKRFGRRKIGWMFQLRGDEIEEGKKEEHWRF